MADIYVHAIFAINRNTTARLFLPKIFVQFVRFFLESSRFGVTLFNGGFNVSWFFLFARVIRSPRFGG